MSASKAEAKLKEMGLAVPVPAKPVAAYIPVTRTGNLVFTSGQIPMVQGELRYRGKLGREFTIEQGYDSARICALNCLGAIKAEIGDLDRIRRIVKVVGFVASAEGFSDQSKVINGASELLMAIFGEAGRHARSAVGVAELPMGCPTEVEMVVEVAE